MDHEKLFPLKGIEALPVYKQQKAALPLATHANDFLTDTTRYAMVDPKYCQKKRKTPG